MFVGIITRRDKYCGAVLRAKVVSSNKKVYRNKDFRVKIKPNGMDDATICMYDVQYAKEILQGYNLSSLTTEISMPAYGPYGSTLTYLIKDSDNGHLLSAYLNSDGTLNGRPKYGSNSGNAEGSISITATKNNAQSSALVNVIIPSYTIDDVKQEILSSSLGAVTKFNLWSRVSGDTDKTYNDTDLSAGNHNIMEPLYLSTLRIDNDSRYAARIKQYTDDEITVTWEINDDLVASNGFTNLSSETKAKILPTNSDKRIKVEQTNRGTTIRPSYLIARELCNDSNLLNYITLVGEQIKERYYVLSGLSIVPTLHIGSEESEVLPPLYCSIRSEQISNQEMEVVYQNIEKLFVGSIDGEQIDFSNSVYEYEATDVAYDITKAGQYQADFGTDTQYLDIYTYHSEGFSTLTYPDYGIDGINTNIIPPQDVQNGTIKSSQGVTIDYPTYNNNNIVPFVLAKAGTDVTTDGKRTHKLFRIDLNQLRSIQKATNDDKYLTFILFFNVVIANFAGKNADGTTRSRTIQFTKTIQINFVDTTSGT